MMRTTIYTGSLFSIVLASGYGSAANAQDCAARVAEARQQLEQQQPAAELRQQVEQMLSRAQSSQNCEAVVSAAEQRLESAGEQGEDETTAAAPSPAESAGSENTTAVTVEQRAAEVSVDTAASQVDVQQRAPQVTVEQPAPEVTITQPEPEVTVRQAEPQVTVNQAEPEVQVSQAEPQVNVETASEPEVRIVEQASESSTEATEPAHASATAQSTRAATISENEALDLVGQTIESREGDALGTVSEIVREGEQHYAVADIGGEQKAIAFDELEFGTNRNLVSLMPREALQSLPQYDAERYTRVQHSATAQMPSFQEADRNADGELDRIEVAALEGIEMQSADTDQNGSLSEEEYVQVK